MAHKKSHPSSEFDNPLNKAAYSTPGKANIQSADAEMKANPPKILAKTLKKKGKRAEKKQRIAILLSKARRGE